MLRKFHLPVHFTSQAPAFLDLQSWAMVCTINSWYPLWRGYDGGYDGGFDRGYDRSYDRGSLEHLPALPTPKESWPKQPPTDNNLHNMDHW